MIFPSENAQDNVLLAIARLDGISLFDLATRQFLLGCISNHQVMRRTPSKNGTNSRSGGLDGKNWDLANSEQTNRLGGCSQSQKLCFHQQKVGKTTGEWLVKPRTVWVVSNHNSD